MPFDRQHPHAPTCVHCGGRASPFLPAGPSCCRCARIGAFYFAQNALEIHNAERADARIRAEIASGERARIWGKAL